MTQHHTLAATVARAIFDRIERDRTLILQNIEEVIRDQLAIEWASQNGWHVDRPEKVAAFLKEWKESWQPEIRWPPWGP